MEKEEKITYDKPYMDLKSEAASKHKVYSKYFKAHFGKYTEVELLGRDIFETWQYFIQNNDLSESDEFECTSDGEIHYCRFEKVENEIYTFKYTKF